MTRYIVINCCYGGFSLSRKAGEALTKAGNAEAAAWLEKYPADHPTMRSVYLHDTPRDDPTLVTVVRQLKSKANGGFAELGIAEVPDGIEWVAQVHETWDAEALK